MDLKQIDSLFYILGETKEEIGGSHYLLTMKKSGGKVPKVNPEPSKKLMKRVHKAIKRGLLLSCHDCSEGGIGVSAAEMAFSGNIGLKLNLRKVPYKGRKRNDFLLFSESNSRFLVEVKRKNQEKFERLFFGLPFSLFGKTIRKPILQIIGVNGKTILEENLSLLKKSFQSALSW